MAGRNIHTVKHENGWANKKEGSKRASSVHPTQAEAIQKGREQAKREKSEHLIHGRDGQIRERNTYSGKDPFPPRG